MEMALTVQEKTTCKDLETIVKNCSLASLDAAGAFEKALVMASGIAGLRQAITPAMLKKIMPLMNTKLGFLTDCDPNKPDKNGKRPTPYSEEVVKECFIEASLLGLSVVGNEFNILFGGVHVTKNGYKRKLKELEGFSDLVPCLKVPKTQDGGAIVSCAATWKYQGKPDSMEREFAVKLQGGMGADAALGKAERRLFKAIYERITGTYLSDGEADDAGVIPTTATREPAKTVVEKLKDAETKTPENKEVDF